MNFEEAYQKLQEGTATDAEVAFVAREIENLRKIRVILDNPALSDPEIDRVEIEKVQKARKRFNRRTLLRTILIVFCSLLIVAAIVCAILFIPSSISAASKQKYSKDQAIDAAYGCLVEQVGDGVRRRCV